MHFGGPIGGKGLSGLLYLIFPSAFDQYENLSISTLITLRGILLQIRAEK